VVRIVISSDCRKLGKTLLGQMLLRELTKAGVPAEAIKLSCGGHGPEGISREAPSGSDTGRFRESGAAEVCFFRYETADELDEFLKGYKFRRKAAVIESNTFMSVMEPDFHIHLISGKGAKPSAKNLETGADLSADGPLDREKAEKLARVAMSLLGFGSVFSMGGKHWLNLDGAPLFGEGRVALLKAVRKTGSILEASRRAGIEYKRAWVLLHDAEDRLGARLIHSDRGGSGGGGTTLTPLADRLLAAWDSGSDEFHRMLDRLEVL